ncbi:YidC/Oxa1 family membrane protein insertase [Candidatus Gottesmanbacteria bacterium]|nr:YidC/Oxa1 family membrane protein insertase [Candidatus Gottesmanbacteria bacterium]
MTNPTLWNQILIWPIVNILVAFYKLFEWLHVPGPMGFAIIGMTVAIRLLLYPLHKDDKTKLQQAQLALYKEHGVNPAAGCLPLLVQMPILIALYNVFYQVLGNGNAGKLISDVNTILYLPILKLTNFDITFFGINLGIKPSTWQTHGWWLLAIPITTGLLQWYQSKLMLPSPAISDKQKVISSADEKKQEEKKPSFAKASEGKEDTAGEMQKQMAIMSPIMFGFFAFQFPLGLSLYWNVFGLFGIMQQLRVNSD